MTSVLGETDIVKYRRDVFQNMAEHLESLKTSIAAAEIKLILTPAEDVIIGEQTYSSEIVLKVLKEMARNANFIEKYLEDLNKGNVVTQIPQKYKSNEKSYNYIIKNIAIISGFIGVGFFAYKLIKLKLKV